MPDRGVDSLLGEIRSAESWDKRVQVVRRIPEEYGTAQLQAVYAAIADEIYRPSLSPMFAYVPWRNDYELEPFQRAYEKARELTAGFTRVSPDDISLAVTQQPSTLRVFRLILAFTSSELADSLSRLAAESNLGTRISSSRLDAIERGRKPGDPVAKLIGNLVDKLMTGQLWSAPGHGLRRKLDKPDTQSGWSSVRSFAREGVPFSVFLHQRHYGGSFRQLLDSTSSVRGDLLEAPVEALFIASGIPYLRSTGGAQADIAERFGLTVRPTPDFVVFNLRDELQAMLECKQANDGGTARDKASRFRSLRAESSRLGGVPLFAVLDGLGWQRTQDALGPVIRDTDGRVFTLATLKEMVTVSPLPTLRATAGQPQPGRRRTSRRKGTSKR